MHPKDSERAGKAEPKPRYHRRRRAADENASAPYRQRQRQPAKDQAGDRQRHRRNGIAENFDGVF